MGDRQAVYLRKAQEETETHVRASLKHIAGQLARSHGVRSEPDAE